MSKNGIKHVNPIGFLKDNPIDFLLLLEAETFLPTQSFETFRVHMDSMSSQMSSIHTFCKEQYAEVLN